MTRSDSQAERTTQLCAQRRHSGLSSRRGSSGLVAWAAGAAASAFLIAGLAIGAPAKPAKPAKADATPASATVPKAAGDAPGAKPATKPAGLPSGRPLPAVLPPDAPLLTDEQVDKAIRKGAEWLSKQFDAKLNVVTESIGKMKEDESYAGGLDALAVYALMQSGLAIPDEKKFDLKSSADMLSKIDAMMKFDLDKGRHSTYAYGLRATALALYLSATPDYEAARVQGDGAKVRQAIKTKLKDDASWGVMATLDGSYSYVKGPKTPKNIKELTEAYDKIKADFAKNKSFPIAKGGYDNSNCQYGLLGVWSAAEAEIEIPSLYWYLVANHWSVKQQGNGTWTYGDDRELGAPINMTAAGMASMLVTHEYIEPAIMQGTVGREPYNPPIKKGLNWFEQGNNVMTVGGGYGTYGVERVGLASGFKFFGQHDWYKELGARVIKSQRPDGSWGSVIETSYYLLFLSRGRHPILMNKLRFDGDAKNPGYWANRPRDIANLSKSVGKLMERQLNWQVINVATPWQEWLDGPILSISSHQAIKFSDDELAKIRNFVEAGGILYTQSDGSAPAFDKYAHQLCNQLFKRELINIPPTHPLYTTESVFKLQPPVPLKMATNGARVLMVHSSADMAKSWQQRDTQGKLGKNYFQMGVNLYIYASGKGELRKRLESPFIAEVPSSKAAPRATVPVARLSYATEWNPEPGAWKRFANYLQWQTSYKAAPTEVKLADLKPYDADKKADPTNYRFAHITGTVAQNWSPEQVKAVKAYVESGGLLLVDVTGGVNAFDQSAQQLIHAALPDAQLQPVAPEHPLLNASAPGMEDVTARKLRKDIGGKLGKTGGQLLMATAGKGAVIYSSIDITSGLLGTNTVGIVGYDSAYAMKLLKNVVLWSMDGMPKGAAAAAAAPVAGDEAPAAPATPASPEAPATPAAKPESDAPAAPAAAPAQPPAQPK